MGFGVIHLQPVLDERTDVALDTPKPRHYRENRLDGENGRTAGGRRLDRLTGRLLKDSGQVKGEKIKTRLRCKLNPIEHLPGRAHPGAEHRAVGRRLMVRVVRRMRDRLRIDESVQQK
jgi:hypothetical protein